MMKTIQLTMLCLFISTFTIAQYTFSNVETINCTSVKSQDRTGTCWSFATSSFLESELIRNGMKNPNISEMYAVRNTYMDKAYNYIYRQGKANFSQGSLSHDVMKAFKKYGAVPESAYSGLLEGSEKHNHGEMEKALKGMLDGMLKSKSLSPKWDEAVNAVLDVYLGPLPEKFIENGIVYTPATYANSLDIDPDDYISITSFSHHQFYEPFILEIPDNYSNGMFYNLPLAEMVAVIENALEKGYSIAWDGDVSEDGFSARQGLAVLPLDADREDLFDNPGKEAIVTRTIRQEGFESYATTDDHLMHLVGTASDQNGMPYYIIKNSWGEIGDYDGYLYMSRPYLEMKTMAIFLHKDAVPKMLLKKLGLK